MMEEIHELVPGSNLADAYVNLAGTYVVKTRSATYLLDFTARTMIRRPRDEMAFELYGDTEAIPLDRLLVCRVGEGLRILSHREDGSPFLRSSTPVESIESS